MKGIILLLTFVGGISCPIILEHAQSLTIDSFGVVPEIVVAAPRYKNEDDAWSGLIDTVVVTTERHENDDIAWSGLMDTTIATAQRYDDENATLTVTMAEGEQNTRGTDDAPLKTSMDNRDSQQSLSKDINSIIFAYIRLTIYHIVLGALNFIFAVFLLLLFT